MGRMAFMVFLLSMIVNNLYVVWAVFPPFEANTPLLIYSDALPAGSITSQSFKPIYMKIPPFLYPSPSTGEGGVGVIFILRCARAGHGGYWEDSSDLRYRWRCRVSVIAAQPAA
jgi:hypothetical protein